MTKCRYNTLKAHKLYLEKLLKRYWECSYVEMYEFINWLEVLRDKQ